MGHPMGHRVPTARADQRALDSADAFPPPRRRGFPCRLASRSALAVVAGAYGASGSHGFDPTDHFDWLVAAGVATAVGTLALAFATGWLGWSTWSDVRATTQLAEQGQRQTEIAQDQVEEARRFREAQFRPFVIVDLDTKTPPALFITVTNVGPIQAKDVRIRFDPPIRTSLESQGVMFDQYQIIRDGIAYLPPGKQHRLLWDSIRGRWEDGDAAKRKPDLPDRYDVQIDYEADLGDGPTRRFSEQGAIDLGDYEGTTVEGQEGLPAVAKQLTQIGKELAKWTATVPRGLRVVTGDDIQRSHQQVLDEVEARKKQNTDAADQDPAAG